MKQSNDVLLGKDDDLVIENGDFKIGGSLTQEVANILRLNQGELKSDPLLGPNLVRLINSNVSQGEFQTIITVQLARDGKNYDEIKSLIALNRKINGVAN